MDIREEIKKMEIAPEITCSAEIDVEKYREFLLHRCAHHLPEDGSSPAIGAIGGKFTYKYTSTTLGTYIKVECACGLEKDITDCSEW